MSNRKELLREYTKQHIEQRKREDEMRLPEIEEDIKDLSKEEIARKIRAYERLLERQDKKRFRDSLTGLQDSNYFRTVALNREVEETKRASHERGLLLVILDIDDFGIINKRFGQHVGDAKLKAVGNKVKSSVRKSDTPCRIGGEEIGILMPHTIPAEDVETNPAERILDAIREIPVTELEHEMLTASIGAGEYKQGETAKQFFDRISTAARLAKILGKNRVLVSVIDDNDVEQYNDITNGKAYRVHVDSTGVEHVQNTTDNLTYIIDQDPTTLKPILKPFTKE